MMPGTDSVIHFRGRLGAQAVTTAHAELSRAGTRRYLLIGLDDGSILDVGGVEPGDTEHHIVLLDPEGRRYAADVVAPILSHGGRCHLVLTDIALRLAEAQADSVSLDGMLVWDAPEASAPPRDGTLQLRSADRMLPPSIAVFQPFGDGWQLSGLVQVSGRLSLSVVLFTEPPALHLIETRTRSGEPDIRRLPTRALAVRVVDAEEHTVVRFQAEADDRLTGFQPIVGQFITQRT